MKNNESSITKSISAATAGDGGFTLIEVLVSVVILTVGLLGVLSISGSAYRGVVYSQQITNTTVISNNIFEGLRKINGDPSGAGLTVGATYTTCYDKTGTAITCGSGEIFTLVYTVVGVNSDGTTTTTNNNVSLKRIDATVTWGSNVTGGSKTSDFTTYIINYVS